MALTHMRQLALTRTVLLSASQAAMLTLELQQTLMSVMQTKNARTSSSVGIGEDFRYSRQRQHCGSFQVIEVKAEVGVGQPASCPQKRDRASFESA